MKNIFGHGAVAAALIALGFVFAGGAGAAGVPGTEPSDSFATLSGHVLPALARATPVVVEERMKAAAAEPELTLTVILRRTDEAGFQAYLHDVYDPASPIFRQFLTPAEVAERFGPAQGDYDAVRAHFEAQGFTLGEGSANRLTLMLNGTRTAAATALRVNVRDYRIGEQQFFANEAEPALPV